MDATFTGQFVYTTTGNTTVTTVASDATSYTASATGFIDVPDTTAADTEYVVPVGSIAKVTGIRIVNNLAQDIGLRFNGAITNAFVIGGLGAVTIMSPAANLVGTDITAVSIVTSDVQAGAGQVEYNIFGDPA